MAFGANLDHADDRWRAVKEYFNDPIMVDLNPTATQKANRMEAGEYFARLRAPNFRGMKMKSPSMVSSMMRNMGLETVRMEPVGPQSKSGSFHHLVIHGRAPDAPVSS